MIFREALETRLGTRSDSSTIQGSSKVTHPTLNHATDWAIDRDRDCIQPACEQPGIFAIFEALVTQ